MKTFNVDIKISKIPEANIDDVLDDIKVEIELLGLTVDIGILNEDVE